MVGAVIGAGWWQVGGGSLKVILKFRGLGTS